MTRRRLVGLVAVSLAALMLALFAADRLRRSGGPQADRRSRPDESHVAADPERPLAEILAERGWRRIPDLNVVVDKSDLTLQVRSGGQVLKTYPIALGSDDLSDKRRRGDRLTPEGEFHVCQRNFIRGSRAWDAVWLRLSYPNAEDAERGLAAGIINERQAREIKRAIRRRRTPPQDTNLGSGIGIHAGGIQPRDWTLGCIALQYAHAVEVYDHLPMGTRVAISR